MMDCWIAMALMESAPLFFVLKETSGIVNSAGEQ
jgi:hypothetical protein